MGRDFTGFTLAQAQVLMQIKGGGRVLDTLKHQ
jgi:hypothetical protein